MCGLIKPNVIVFLVTTVCKDEGCLFDIITITLTKNSRKNLPGVLFITLCSLKGP